MKKYKKSRTISWFWAPIPPHPLPLPRASGGLSLSLSFLRLQGLSPIAAASLQFRYRLFAFFGYVAWRLPGAVVGSEGGGRLAAPSDPTTAAGRRVADPTMLGPEHFSKNVLPISGVISWISVFDFSFGTFWTALT